MSPAMAAKKRPASSAAELAKFIDLLHTEIDAFLDKRLAELKSSRDGAGLPVQMLRKMMLGADPLCPCQLARKLINESN